MQITKLRSKKYAKSINAIRVIGVNRIISVKKMNKLKIEGKELRAIGYPEGPVISIAMNVMEKHYKHHSKEEAMEILR